MLAALLAVLGAVLLVPSVVLCMQVLAACLPRRNLKVAADTGPEMAVLVPAHDERLSIAAVVMQLRSHLASGDRVLVVADNCTDDTAALARQAGAEVVERNDPSRRGKGYALDFGVRHLAARPPQIVVVMDADCTVTAGSLRQLAAACAGAGVPVQAHYAMAAGPGAPLTQQVAAFAWLVKNLVRPLGMARLGLPCQLMGTGMAFPWPVLAASRLATGQIVEDLKLGIDCALAGTPTRFLPEVTVQSAFPESREGLHSQRSRWEHGHLAMILSQAPRLFGAGVRRGRLDVVAMALDLAVPPVALLVMLVGTSLAASLAAWAMGVRSAQVPVVLLTSATLAIAAAVLLSWARFGRTTISLVRLASAPWYALRKTPVYLAFMLRRQKKWVRTKRD